MLKKRSDIAGIFITGLCAVHCAVTPLLFTVLPVFGSSMDSHAHHSHDTGWWRALDFVFLLFGFIAIRYSTKHSNHTFLQYGFWITWIALAVGLVLKRIEHPIGNDLMYVSSALLILTHLVNYYLQSNKKWKPQISGNLS